MEDKLESTQALTEEIITMKAVVQMVFESSQENLVAVADVEFLNPNGSCIFKIKGFRIISENDIPTKEFTILFPSYSTRRGRYYPTFASDDEMFEQKINQVITMAFMQSIWRNLPSPQPEEKTNDVF